MIGPIRPHGGVVVVNGLPHGGEVVEVVGPHGGDLVVPQDEYVTKASGGAES
jgi:hypothetical protein